MKVILQRDIPKLGRHGDVVTVADGYARNYLLPRQHAVPASGGALKELKARMEREQERIARTLASARAGAEKMENLRLVLVGRVGSGTKLYGSITAQDVADAIQKETGVEIDKRRVGLVDPIKSLGTYTVPVRLHSDVVVQVRVEVMTEEQLEQRRAQEAAVAAASEAERAAAETSAAAGTPETADQSAAESAGQEPTPAA